MQIAQSFVVVCLLRPICEIAHFVKCTNSTVHFVTWTNSSLICHQFHEMDKGMHGSLNFIHGNSYCKGWPFYFSVVSMWNILISISLFTQLRRYNIGNNFTFSVSLIKWILHGELVCKIKLKINFNKWSKETRPTVSLDTDTGNLLLLYTIHFFWRSLFQRLSWNGQIRRWGREHILKLLMQNKVFNFKLTFIQYFSIFRDFYNDSA